MTIHPVHEDHVEPSRLLRRMPTGLGHRGSEAACDEAAFDALCQQFPAAVPYATESF